MLNHVQNNGVKHKLHGCQLWHSVQINILFKKNPSFIDSAPNDLRPAETLQENIHLFLDC